jgi:hypothetical protein
MHGFEKGLEGHVTTEIKFRENGGSNGLFIRCIALSFCLMSERQVIAEVPERRHFFAVQGENERFERFRVAEPAIFFAVVPTTAESGLAEEGRVGKERGGRERMAAVFAVGEAPVANDADSLGRFVILRQVRAVKAGCPVPCNTEPGVQLARFGTPT